MKADACACKRRVWYYLWLAGCVLPLYCGELSLALLYSFFGLLFFHLRNHNRGCRKHSALNFSSDQVLVEVVGGEVVGREDMEGVAVDFDVATDWKVCRCQERVVIVDVLVLSAVEELAFDDSRVLLSGLVHAN